MTYERLEYTTGDQSLRVDFVFMYLGLIKGWRIYIINDIDYTRHGHRDTSGHATHRNHFSNDTYNSICWDGKISKIEKAKAVASLWADATALYIKFGGRFDDHASRLINQK